MPSPFTSSRAKLDWASQHLAAFEEVLVRFFADPANALGVKCVYHPRSEHFVWRVKSLPDVPVEWGLRVGDILHNLRSSLDHLAWSLVRMNGVPTEEVQYPIYSTPVRFGNSVDRRLPGVASSIRAVIEARQPYGGFEVVATLQRLSNTDKHQLIHVMALNESMGDIRFGDWSFRNFQLTGVVLKARNAPVRMGMTLYRFCGRATGPDPQMDIEHGGRASLGLDDGTKLLNVLPEMVTYVEDTLTAVEEVIAG